MTNRYLSAEEARNWGLLNRVVPLEKLMDTALELAADIKSMPPLSIKAVKESINRGMGGYEYSRAIFGYLQGTEDAAEGYAAFSEKRSPEFKGK